MCLVEVGGTFFLIGVPVARNSTLLQRKAKARAAASAAENEKESQGRFGDHTACEGSCRDMSCFEPQVPCDFTH